MTTAYSTVEVYQQIEAPPQERLEVIFLLSLLIRNYTKTWMISLMAFLESLRLFKILRRTYSFLHKHVMKLFVDA